MIGYDDQPHEEKAVSSMSPHGRAPELTPRNSIRHRLVEPWSLPRLLISAGFMALFLLTFLVLNHPGAPSLGQIIVHWWRR